MKLKNILLSAGITGFSFAGLNAQAQFDKIIVQEKESVIKTAGYKNDCIYSYINFDGNRLVTLATQLDSERAVHELIKSKDENESDENKYFYYESKYVEHLTATCEKWGADSAIYYTSSWDNSFPHDRVEKIININKYSEKIWKEFLNDEIKKWRQNEENSDSLIFEMHYQKINDYNFPEKIRAKKIKNENLLSEISLIDSNKDCIYDIIKLRTFISEECYREELIKINHETNLFYYSVNFPDSVKINNSRLDSFSLENQGRIKKILNLKSDFENNEMINFLYEEFESKSAIKK